MQGHFDLTMLHTPGLTRDLIEAVRREGGDPKVEKFLAQFKKEGQWSTDNLIFKVAPSFLYYHVISGPSVYGQWGDGGNPTGLAYITLTTTSTEPSYTGEETSYSYGVNWQTGMPDNVGNNPSKQFINGCVVTPDFKVDAAGREAVYGKFKWLYLPGEATSSTIRSVTIWGIGNTGDFNYHQKTRMGRVRIKDSGGNPVTISKTNTRSLLIEYTFTMPTL